MLDYFSLPNDTTMLTNDLTEAKKMLIKSEGKKLILHILVYKTRFYSMKMCVFATCFIHKPAGKPATFKLSVRPAER